MVIRPAHHQCQACILSQMCPNGAKRCGLSICKAKYWSPQFVHNNHAPTSPLRLIVIKYVLQQLGDLARTQSLVFLQVNLIETPKILRSGISGLRKQRRHRQRQFVGRGKRQWKQKWWRRIRLHLGWVRKKAWVKNWLGSNSLHTIKHVRRFSGFLPDFKFTELHINTGRKLAYLHPEEIHVLNQQQITD